jgi:outer membrane phospholipase A
MLNNWLRLICVALCIMGGASCPAVGQIGRPFLIPPTIPASSTNARISVLILNTGEVSVRQQFPAEYSARLTIRGVTKGVALRRSGAVEVEIPPGKFAIQEYSIPIPDDSSDTIQLSLGEESGQWVTMRIETQKEIPVLSGPTPVNPGIPSVGDRPWIPPKELKSESVASEFFHAQFFPSEPMYIVMGWEDPNIKFQISFKYRLINAYSPDPGWLARRAPAVTNIYIAYTQTSLWDTSSSSSPFYDTNYKPEVFYQWRRVDRGRWADWFTMDLQGGLQHASNGQGGLDSRSVNVTYLMPTFYFGNTDSFYFRIAPRVYAYIGSLDDNPDIASYYGHIQLRGMLGWADSLQLAVIGTIGNGFHHGNAQLDLTYPLYKLVGGNLAIYLDLQYFTGYGESLLDYNVRSSAFRMGFSLWR